MTNIIKTIPDKTISWLLEKENPSVRYGTLTKLLNQPENSKEVTDAKQDIMSQGVVPKILKKQNETGHWGEPQRFYLDKYSGTVWQLIILAELGADKNNRQVKKACEFILNNSQEKESFGFSFRKSIKSQSPVKNEIIPCLTGNMVWSLIKLGYVDDDRVKRGIEWICKYQRCDDGIDKEPHGWPYDRYKMCWGKHTCHMGVVKSLKALAAIPKNKRNNAVNHKIKELAEYLLVHKIHKKSHEPEKISRPGWLKLGFPLMYQTDILEILGILTDLGYQDKRMNEAVEILKKKQNIEGKWKLENSFNGRTSVNIETKGKESKWISLKALYVLSKY